MQLKELRNQLESARQAGKKAWKTGIDEASQLHPEEPLVWFHKGEYAMENWDWEEALEYLEKAHQKEPENSLYKSRLAHVLTTRGKDKARALSLIQELVATEPENKTHHFQLAQYHLEQWDKKEALKHLERVLELDPMHVEARVERSKAYLSEGKAEKALSDAELLIERFPKEDRYWQLKGEVLAVTGNRVEQAVAALRKAVELNPDNRTARANIANYYFNARQYARAIEAYTERLEATGETAKLYEDRAECLLELEEYEKALSDLDKAAALGAQEGNFHLKRGKAQFGLKNYEATAKELEEALAKGCWQEGQTRLTLAKAYLKLQELEKAAATLEKATDDFMCGDDAHYLLGNIREQQGDKAKALEHWKVAADKHHVEAQEKLEALQRDSASAQSGLDEFKGAAEKNAQSPFLQSLFGKCWVVDMKKTRSSSTQINAMPSAMVDVFMQMFTGISVELTPAVLKLNNVMGTDVEAPYRIEEEGDDFLKLYGKPEGQDGRNIELERVEEHLIFNMEANGQPMQLWLREQAEGESQESESMNPEEMLEGLMSGLGKALSNLSNSSEEQQDDEAEEREGASLGDKIAAGLGSVLENVLKQQEEEEEENPNLKMASSGPALQDVLFDTWHLDSEMTLSHGLPFKNFPAVMHDKLRKQFEEAYLTVAEKRLEMAGGGQTTRGDWEAIEQGDYYLKAKGYRDGDEAPADFEFTLLPAHLRMKMQTAKEQSPTIFFFKRS